MVQNYKRSTGPVPPPLKNTKKPTISWGYIVAAIYLLIAAVVLMAISMRMFLRVVSLLGIALTICSVIVMLLTYRKSREIKPKAMYIAMGMSFACLLVYSLFLRANLGSAVWLIGFSLGAGVGIGWSYVTPMFREGTAIKRKGNIWYLAVWGAIFVLNQFLVMTLGRTSGLSMLLLIFGTGLAVGSSGTYVLRYNKLKAEC